MILGKIIGIFVIVFIGFGANRIGWLPIEASKYLSKIVVNIAGPCVILSSISEQSFTMEGLQIMGIICALYFGQYAFQQLVAMGSRRALRVERRDRGVFSNFFLYTNNGFMGFPVTYAIFGTQGMFYMVIINVFMPFFMYTHGVANLRKDTAHTAPADASGAPAKKSGGGFRAGIKEILTVPVVASLVGLVIYFLKIPVHPQVKDLLDVVGAMMTPLSMIVIGLQLTESSPRRVMLNHRLVAMSLLRVLIMPLAFVGVGILLRLPPLLFGVLTLNIMLPCAALPVVLAEEYGANATLAAEGTFLSTLFSMATIPVAALIFANML